MNRKTKNKNKKERKQKSMSENSTISTERKVISSKMKNLLGNSGASGSSNPTIS